MNHTVVIATVSWARTRAEQKIILATLKKLSLLNMPIVLADEARSEFPIAPFVKNIGNVYIVRGYGMDQRIKKSLLKASSNGKFICFLESDKLEFAHKHIFRFINAFLKNPKGVWFPSRTSKSFHRYSSYQQNMEQFLWETFRALAKQKRLLDISYGPRIFPSYLAKYLLLLNKNIRFGWQGYLLIIAYRLHLSIHAVAFDVIPPQDIQKNQELVLHRMQQTADHLEGMRIGLSVTL